MEKEKKKFDGEKIWEELKSKEVQMFNLPGQAVENCCKVIAFTDKEVLIKAKASALLPALEDTFKDLVFEQSTDGIYISIKKKEVKEIK